MPRTPQLRLLAACAALAAVWAAPTHAGLHDPGSIYRKVRGTEGNCIFSASALPYDKEAEYKGLSDHFTTSNRVTAGRCYFPQQVKDYLSKGTIWSQLRDEGTYTQLISVEPEKAGNPIFTSEFNFRPTAETLEWDQVRVALGTDDPNCSAKDTTSLGTKAAWT